MDIALFTPNYNVGKVIQTWKYVGGCTTLDKSNSVFDAWARQILQCRGLPAAQQTVALTSSNKEQFVVPGNRGSMALGGQPIVYGSPSYKPPDPVTARRLSRSGSTRAEWEDAKRTGKIHVTPYLKASLVVRDDPIVLSSSASYTTLPWNCSPYEDVFSTTSTPACNRTLYQFGEDWLEHFPKLNTVNLWTIQGRYTCYKDAVLGSALEGHRSDVQEILNGIADAILYSEPNSGLITTGTAALNAGIIDALTTLAEMPETVRFIYSGLFTILDMRRAATRRAKDIKATVKNAQEQVTRLAELWMSFRYGIMPIVYSVNDAVAVLEQKGVFRTIRRSMPSSVVVPINGVNVPIPFTERYWGKARVDMDSGAADLQLNLLATAWEVVPLSYVLDWVFNVGDFLSALLPPSGAQEIKHTYSWRAKATIPLLIGDRALYGELDFYRNLPINPIDHLGLTIDPNMSWRRWLDALSLTWFAYRSK